MSRIPVFLRFKPFQAPARFVYRDPDTSQVMQANTKPELVQLIVAYRAQNRLEPIERIDLFLENYWCNLPENAYKCAKVEVLPRGLFATIKGGMVVLKNYFYKRFAPQETADLRARQCTRCPFNITPGMIPAADRDAFIEYANKVAEASVGERKSTYHEELGECAACGCPLRAKVFYEGELSFRDDQLVKLKSAKCWQLALVRNQNG